MSARRYYGNVCASSGDEGIPSGASFDVMFLDSTGSSTVDTIADRIVPARSWVGALEAGTKWTRDTTEKTPHATGLSTTGSGFQAHVEYLDTGGDNLAATFGALIGTAWTFVVHAKYTNTPGSTERRALFGIRNSNSSSASTFVELVISNPTADYQLMVGTAANNSAAKISIGGPPTGWHSWGATYASGVITYYQDGAAITTTTAINNGGAYANVTGLTRSYVAKVGDNASWKGYMARASGYTTALSAANMLAWHNSTVAEYV